MSPLVSVVVPTFRRHALLCAAVASIVRQTHRPIEVIVVDDNDDPTTAAVVSEVLPDDHDLRFLALQTHRLGAAAARNVGLEAARGQYVQFLDDDDELFPEKLRAQVATLSRGEVDVVFGDWRQGQDLESAVLQRRRTALSHFAYLLGESWVPQFAYLARLDICRQCGGWDPTLRYNDDFDFFLRLAANGARFAHEPVITGFYRWHAGPRVSRDRRERPADVTGRIVQRAWCSLERTRPPTAPEHLALVRRWEQLAEQTRNDSERFDANYSMLNEARKGANRPQPWLERHLDPRTAFRLRTAVRLGTHIRRAVHATLPLSIRRAVRVTQRRILADA